LSKRSNSEIETGIFGLAHSVTGLFGLGRFGLETFGQTMKSCRNLTG